MNLLEFLRSLDWQMNLYEVEINWKWSYRCPVCGKVYYWDDDEYSVEGATLDEYRDELKGHHIDYPDVYKEEISHFEVIIKDRKIAIEYIDLVFDTRVCRNCMKVEECEDMCQRKEAFCKWHDRELKDVTEWQQEQCGEYGMHCENCENLEKGK